MMRSGWATAWIKRDKWSHNIFLLCGKDPKKVIWVRDHLRLPEIAEFWKDWLASSESAMDEI